MASQVKEEPRPKPSPRPTGAPPSPGGPPDPAPPRDQGRRMYSDLPAAQRLRVVEILRGPFQAALAELYADREHARAA